MHQRARSPYVALLLSSLVPGCIVNTVTQTVSESGGGEEATDTDAATDTDVATDTDTDTGTGTGTGTETGTETGTDTDTDTSSTPVCGDGVVDDGEDCDDGGESALCNDDCTLAACGDGVINTSAAEECEGADLGGLTCASLGYTGGMLACDEGCALDESGCSNEAPAAPSLSLSFSAVKQFDFAWAAVAEADYYRLEQRATYVDPFVPVSGDIVGTSFSLTVPLHFRHESGYRLLACNEGGCTPSVPLGVMGSLVQAIGYVKASNTDTSDQFGHSLALSADGTTLAVGTVLEDGGAIGIDGNGANESAPSAGAVYVYTSDGMGGWTQQAYVKPSNTEAGDAFGQSVSLSADGSTLAVGAVGEDGGATGINGDQGNGAGSSGAVYVYVRDAMGVWTQQAYVKASNTGAADAFGTSVSLSGDGTTLAVGASGEDGSSTGIGGDQASNAASASGAVYAFVRDGLGQWSQQAYIKASNTEANDLFGGSVSLSGDGNRLAVGAIGEDGNAVGVGGDQLNNLAAASGAVYVFARDGVGAWTQQAYVKASNTGSNDELGGSVAISSDGGTLVAGAIGEDGGELGINGNQSSNAANAAGAAYVFVSNGMGGWSQQAYVKASNTAQFDAFGGSVSLGAEGDVLAVGARQDNATAAGINGSQIDSGSSGYGSAYVFSRNAMGGWTQRAFVKASNPGTDEFGAALTLSADGDTLAVSAPFEDGNATGVGGDQTNNQGSSSGAVYLY